MLISSKLLSAGLLVTGLTLPIAASAVERLMVACSVAIDYSLNDSVVETYNKDFVLQPGIGFVNDFSTTLRSKVFTASVAREAADAVVLIDYFNDAGVFHAISFNTRLTLPAGAGIETTSGSHGFATTLGVVGNHRTSYTLTCRRR